MNLKETYNRIAEDWFKDHKDDDWWVEGTDKLISLLQPGDTVLDVGCGAGIKSKYLSDKGLKVTGIDFSDKFIDIAQREVPEASFQVLDMREVSKLGTQFDAVFAQASLLHIPKGEIVEVVGKLVSVLKPGGYLYLAVKKVYADGKEEDVLKESDYGYEYERFFSYYSMSELEEYLKKFDLKLVFQNTNTPHSTTWLQIIGQKG